MRRIVHLSNILQSTIIHLLIHNSIISFAMLNSYLIPRRIAFVSVGERLGILLVAQILSIHLLLLIESFLTYITTGLLMCAP